MEIEQAEFFRLRRWRALGFQMRLAVRYFALRKALAPYYYFAKFKDPNTGNRYARLHESVADVPDNSPMVEALTSHTEPESARLLTQALGYPPSPFWRLVPPGSGLEGGRDSMEGFDLQGQSSMDGEALPNYGTAASRGKSHRTTSKATKKEKKEAVK